MALLSNAQRRAARAEVVRLNNEDWTIVKEDLDAVLSAIDKLSSDEAATWNATLPLPGRTGMTKAQKALAFAAILRQRYVGDL